MAKALTTREIMDILPHRSPFLLVDAIEDFKEGEYAIGRKCITYDEPYFQGHFPEMPIMPGVLQVEALAQTGAVAILSEEENRGKIALFGGIKDARFKAQVRPGDVLELSCEITSRRGPVGIGTAQAMVNGKLAAKEELTFAILEE